MKTILIYNSHSGNFNYVKNKDKIINELRHYVKDDITVFASTGPKSITEVLIKEGEGFELAVVFGGDGTLNEAINGLMHLTKRPRLLYVPTGTVNDVGHMLGLKRNYKKTFKLLADDAIAMDVCRMNELYFTYVGACGKFTSVSYDTRRTKAKRFFGKMHYYWLALKELIYPLKVELTVKTKKQEIKGTYFLMLAMNSQRIGSFFIRKKKNVCLNDNSINLYLFDATRFGSVFNMFNYFFFGDYLKHGITELVGNEFLVIAKKPIVYNVDGEKAFEEEKIEIKVLHNAINIYASKKAKKKYFIE